MKQQISALTTAFAEMRAMWTQTPKPPSWKRQTSAVSSHAVGEEELATAGFTGRCPETLAKIDGRLVKCLVDTGSEVSTVTESWFHQHFTNSHLQESHWFTLKAANGLDIPYVGLLEAEVDILGKVCRAPILVVKDAADPSTRRRKQEAPGLIGMNILSKVAGGLMFQGGVPTFLQPAIREARLEQTSVRGLGRVCRKVLLPAQAITCVKISGPELPHRHLLAEPTSCQLPPGIILVPTLVGPSNNNRYIRVANLSSEDRVLQPRTPIVTLHAIDSIESPEGLHRHVSSGAVFVDTQASVTREAPESVEPELPDFDGTAQHRQALLELLKEHQNVFSKGEQDLGYTDQVRHQIRITDEGPISQPYRSLPLHQYGEVREHLKGLLASGVIKESSSPYAAPTVIVRKKDGSIRLCVDYRRLNLKTIPDAYPLPRIQETFDALVGARFITTLDLASGYHQIAMDPNDACKTVFCTPFGLFEYTRMPFGLMTAPPPSSD